jgi:hypothetical protein
MKVLIKGIMPNGTPIQIEEWHEDYDFMPYGRTLASYPLSKVSHEGSYSPQRNKPYRFEFDFGSHEEAREAFASLMDGSKQLSDFKDKMCYPNYADCI